jgi:hypothetical protein
MDGGHRVLDFSKFRETRLHGTGSAAVGVVSRPLWLARRPPVLSSRQVAHREQMLRHLSAAARRVP